MAKQTVEARRTELRSYDRKRLKNIHRAYYKGSRPLPEDKELLVADIIIIEHRQGVIAN